MPQRILQQRRRGWRMPARCVSVCRPGVLGNPFIGADAVQAFRAWAEGLLAGTPPMIEAHGESVVIAGVQFSATVAGRLPESTAAADRWRKAMERIGREQLDVACFCPLDRPCHGDVILELARRWKPGT